MGYNGVQGKVRKDGKKDKQEEKVNGLYMFKGGREGRRGRHRGVGGDVASRGDE